MSDGLAADKVGLVLSTKAAPGVLHQLTGVIAKHNGDIRSVSIIEDLPTDTRIYFELDIAGGRWMRWWRICAGLLLFVMSP